MAEPQDTEGKRQRKPGPVLAPARMARVMALAPKPQAPKTATTKGTAEDRGAKFVELGGDAKCAQGQRRGEGRTPDKKPAPGGHPLGAHPPTQDDTCAKQGQDDEEGVQDGGQSSSSSSRAATALVGADDCELSIPGEARPTSSWGAVTGGATAAAWWSDAFYWRGGA
ncbi:hypothetical protein PHYSODRAFT_264648 [Phytophthora sojae]|uniref:Uncharacterized protein n=1 Tax=Phytophthora sojae (strain P6497) TaxID=1094619 RepID=G5A266_PHYSP|nr:hypothetical protein PHYSODRAFT_264648 [Phytophthora sojae]EGZ11014.1 hypothetical protein PHYSODRAFT_264648 [Phytophthora sojae]|eukprot:XP_009533759.1 hypothetical protein PHYSODRAFT_264648 [Phytophthora sojae]